MTELNNVTVSIFLVLCLVVFLLPNNAFGWLQAIGSLVKIILFIFILFLSFALIAGAGPTGTVHTGESWRDGQAFRNGFIVCIHNIQRPSYHVLTFDQGFANCAMLAIWAVGDQVFIGVMGGEAKSPRYSMAHAATLVPLRVGFMYMVLVVLVGILVSPDNPNLLGASGSAASPFVLAVKDAGIKGVPDIVNACMIIGILAIALESIYLPSRILRTMALQDLIPAVFGKCDDKGRPRWALAFTSVIGVVMTYMSLSGKSRIPAILAQAALLTT
jgi:yeast amino acid transporter